MESSAIWHLYEKDLTRFILSEVKDPDLCYDLLQETFIRLHLNLHKLKDEDKSKQWLLRIAKNLITDHYRKTKKTLPAHTEEIIEDKNMNEGFAKCISSFLPKLSPNYRHAIVLSDLRKVDQVKSAAALSLSYSTFKSRVQRGRAMLKKMFLDCCNISTDKYGNVTSYKSKPACSTCGI